MDNKLIRFYNQNRKLFWVIVITIIAVIVLIHVLNAFVKSKNEQERTQESITKIQSIEESNNYSVISNKQLDVGMSQEINEFIDCCNNGEIDNAYNLLSNDCKEILYPDVESFKNNYYNKIFSSKKLYAYQAMYIKDNLYTYKIDFTEDILQTGKPSKTSIVDYYTIVTDKEEKKLNINKLIGKKILESECNIKQIDAKLNYKIIYYDYEIYNISLKNNSSTKVILDNFHSPQNIFIEDKDGTKYLWANYEYTEDEMVLNKGLEKNLFIKFYKEYKPSMEVKKMIFKNVIINNKIKSSIEIDIL